MSKLIKKYKLTTKYESIQKPLIENKRWQKDNAKKPLIQNKRW